MSFPSAPLRRLALLTAWFALSGAAVAAESATPSTHADDDVVQLSESNVLFFYEAHADFRSTPESLTAAFSSDYRNAPNEFAKQSLLQTVQPVIERKVKEAGETRQVMLRVNWAVPEYDFKRQGFPTGISSSSFVTFQTGGAQYAVAYKSVKAFTFLPVPQAQAAAFANELSRSRDGYLEVVGEIVSGEEQLLNGNGYKTLYLRPSGMTFHLRSGAQIGSLQAAKP